MGCDGAPVSPPRLAIGGTPARLYRVGSATHLEHSWSRGLAPDGGCEASTGPADVYELAPADASSLPLLAKSQD
jgi:hypothetical protein